MPSTLNLIQKGRTDLGNIIIIMNDVNLSLTDYHLNYRQSPTMMGSCHGGNVLGNLIDYSVIVKNVLYCCKLYHQVLRQSSSEVRSVVGKLAFASFCRDCVVDASQSS